MDSSSFWQTTVAQLARHRLLRGCVSWEDFELAISLQERRRRLQGLREWIRGHKVGRWIGRGRDQRRSRVPEHCPQNQEEIRHEALETVTHTRRFIKADHNPAAEQKRCE